MRLLDVFKILKFYHHSFFQLKINLRALCSQIIFLKYFNQRDFRFCKMDIFKNVQNPKKFPNFILKNTESRTLSLVCKINIYYF
jgi:hypothetical protein